MTEIITNDNLNASVDAQAGYTTGRNGLPAKSGNIGHQFCYSAGVMILSKEHPQTVLYRSVKPILKPELPQETHGTIANVVFPTGIDRRDDLGKPDYFDIYYGMADNRIGAARLDLPDILPPGGLADPLDAIV